MGYHTTTRLKAEPSLWSPHRPQAEVLHGSQQGRFVAITINIRGTSWYCHPRTDGNEWGQRARRMVYLKKEGRWLRVAKPSRLGQPPRWVRKAAKMALRRWLTP